MVPRGGQSSGGEPSLGGFGDTDTMAGVDRPVAVLMMLWGRRGIQYEWWWRPRHAAGATIG